MTGLRAPEEKERATIFTFAGGKSRAVRQSW
jgi:hypothetical protein